MNRRFWMLACGLGFVAVAAGAFGSHALAAKLSPARLDTWDTAVRYLFYHLPVVLLLASGVLGEHAAQRWAVRLFAVGMIIFSGSLFAFVLLDLSWLGAITPLGGAFLLGGWICALWALRARPA